MSFEPVLPPVLAGGTHAGACVSMAGIGLPPGIGTDLVARLGAPQADEPALQREAAAGYTELLRVDKLVRGALRSAAPTGVGDLPDLPATGTGGAATLSGQLELVARCVEAGVPTRVYSVSLGGFDTHAQEIAGHERLMKQLDAALTGFVDRMARSAAGRQVVVAVYSEFGRRVRANGSDGTDHGTAGPVLVVGPRVNGGFYGEQPSLAKLDHDDLQATVDFRTVYGTLLASVLDAEPERYLDGFRVTPMRFLPAG